MFKIDSESALGLAILSIPLFFIFGYFIELMETVAVGLTWLVCLLLFPNLARAAQVQSGLLVAIGLLLCGLSDGPINWYTMLSVNLPLIIFFISLSTLSLLPDTSSEQDKVTGKTGFWQTMTTVHLLGSAINMSIVFVVANALSADGKQLQKMQWLTIMRGFCGCAFWSPFFVAMGVALSFAQGADYVGSVLPGLALVPWMLLLTYWDVHSTGHLAGFKGYPLTPSSLKLPLVLAVAVIFGQWWLSDWKMLSIISMAVPIVVSVFTPKSGLMHRIKRYMSGPLMAVNSQLTLFLAAGIFAAGIQMLLSSYAHLIDLQSIKLDELGFALVSLGMILLAIFGVHPVMSISVVAPILLPVTPDPNQLAFLFLTVWGISTPSTSLSGIGLTMVARYRLSGKAILTSNWHYVVLMWLMQNALNIVWFY